MNVVAAVAYHFCLALPAAFTQPGDHLLSRALYSSNVKWMRLHRDDLDLIAMNHLQGRAKLMELSLVTHVPSGPIGFAWAGHFARQK